MAEPEGVETIHVMNRFSGLVQRQLEHSHRSVGTMVDIFPVGVVGIETIHIVDLMPSEQNMPQVGVELDVPLVGAATDLDSPECLVPYSLALFDYRVKIPSRSLRGKVFPRVFDTGVGHGDLHIYRFRVKAERHPGSISHYDPGVRLKSFAGPSLG